jgi:citrate lyase subunit beta / citryl-CoA lyase
VSAIGDVIGARSWLYVPGDRPERFAKALASGADAVIFDLEDAVALPAKNEARAAVAEALGNALAPCERWVRINVGDRGLDDLAMVTTSPGLSGVVVPKASTAVVEIVGPHLGAHPFMALVESAAAVLELPALADAHPDLVGLAMGEVDLAADLGIEATPYGEELWPIRLSVVVASSAAAIAPPVGPVWVAVRDIDGLRDSTVDLKRRGFGGRQAIHPDQVPVINEAFTPTPEQVEQAETLLSLADGSTTGAFLDTNGRMIDEAVLRSARRTVALASRWAS